MTAINSKTYFLHIAADGEEFHYDREQSKSLRIKVEGNFEYATTRNLVSGRGAHMPFFSMPPFGGRLGSVR